MDMSKFNGVLQAAEDGRMLLVTMGFRGDADEKKVVADARAFLTRVDRLREKKGLDKTACLWAVGRKGEDGGYVRMLMQDGLTRLDMQKMWPHGLVGVITAGSVPVNRLLGGCLAALFVWDLTCKKYDLVERLAKCVWVRYALWTVLLLLVLCFGAYGTGYNAAEFVYFQF